MINKVYILTLVKIIAQYCLSLLHYKTVVEIEKYSYFSQLVAFGKN